MDEPWEELREWLKDKPESIDGVDVLNKMEELENKWR